MDYVINCFFFSGKHAFRHCEWHLHLTCAWTESNRDEMSFWETSNDTGNSDSEWMWANGFSKCSHDGKWRGLNWERYEFGDALDTNIWTTWFVYVLCSDEFAELESVRSIFACSKIIIRYKNAWEGMALWTAHSFIQKMFSFVPWISYALRHYRRARVFVEYTSAAKLDNHNIILIISIIQSSRQRRFTLNTRLECILSPGLTFSMIISMKFI